MKKIILSAFLLVTPLVTNAQMFSYSETQTIRRPSTTFLRVGLPTLEFQYKGGSVASLNNLELNQSGIFIGIESPSFNLALNMANRLTGAEDQNLTSFEIGYNNNINLVSRSAFRLALPLHLASTLLSVTNDISRDDFNQLGISFNPGVLLDLRLKNKIQLVNQANLGYGFSSSSGGFFGGSVSGLNLKSRINILRLIGGRSISFGYDYLLRSYDIDGEEFDYDLNGHTFSIGISI